MKLFDPSLIQPRRALLPLLGLLISLAARPTWGADLPALIERSKASIVLVGSYSPTDTPRFGFRGTGFAVDDGSLVATNAHVLLNPEVTEAEQRVSVQARRPDGEWALRSARVVALDRSKDLAVLRVEGPPIPPLRLAAAGLAKEGMPIILMGFPIGGALGYSTVTHRGMVSAITPITLPASNSRSLDPRALRQLRAGNFDILQLDATAYPGNSGGPVLDQESGQVIGIINMVLTKAGRESALSQPSGISYAIPATQLAPLVDAAKAQK